MPTISSGISIALQAVLTQSQVLEVTQHNIANASTPGYRRQAAILTAATASSVNAGEYVLGAGQRGSGVTVQRIQRFNLDFFDGRYRSVTAESNNWQAQSEILSQLEPMLAETTDAGLLPKLDQFWAGWQTLSNDPTNTSLRATLLNDAGMLASAFNQRSSTIKQFKNDQNLAVTSQVDQINNLAGQVAQLNGEISRVISVGEQPNDLLDKRDLALDQLSQLTGSASFEQKNGETMVSIGGHVLVVGHDAIKVEARTSLDPQGMNVVNAYWSDNAKLAPPSGKLKGILEARDTVLSGQLDSLNTMASNLMTAVNTIHSGGYGLDNTTGMSFFLSTDPSNVAGTMAVNSNLTIDNLATSSAANQPGNNEIAMQLANLKTSKVPGPLSLNDQYSAQITKMAILTQQASDNSYQHGLVEKALADQRESVVGVSLDEEAANMAKAQKAYQAAARVMTTYNDLLDTIINRMGVG